MLLSLRSLYESSGPGPSALDDDAASWWGGAQKCFASVAVASVLAATLATAAIAQQVQQDREQIPAGTLYGQPDEDFWQNPVAPVRASLYRSPLFADQDEIPAGSLFGQPEEDLWQNPVRPVLASLFQVLPYSFDAGDIVPQPAAPIPDEDFWQNPVAPVQATLYRSPLFTDPEEIPAGSLFGQADEDFWRNPVAPVPASLVWPQQFSFDVQEPAGALRGQPDEDFWQNPVQPVPASLYRSTLFPDPEEIPAGALLKGQPDEDFWINPVAPVAARLFQNLPYFFDPVDFIPPVPPIQDEDFWQNPVAPVQASLYRSPLFSDPEELPAHALVNAKPDEDYWRNPTAPVADTLYQRLPYAALGDPEELNAGDEFGQYDEDFWINPVAPVQGSLYRTPICRDPEEVPAGSLKKFTSPDEDYWQNRVAPIAASLYQTLPYLYDAVDSGNLVAQVVTTVTTLGGGIAWPYPDRGLSERHWSAPPSSELPVKKGKQKSASIAGTARPAGLSAQVTLGQVVVSGSARARAEGQKVRSSLGTVQIQVAATLYPASESHRVHRYGMGCLGRVQARGIRNPSDEDLLWILGEIE